MRRFTMGYYKLNKYNVFIAAHPYLEDLTAIEPAAMPPFCTVRIAEQHSDATYTHLYEWDGQGRGWAKLPTD